MEISPATPADAAPLPKTLTPRQVQEIYGFSEDTLATWRRREIADGKRRGPRWIPFGPHAIRYRVVDLDEWIAARVANRVTIGRQNQAPAMAGRPASTGSSVLLIKNNGSEGA